VALVIVPVLCAMFMRLDGEPRRRPSRPAARWTLAGLGVLLLLLVARASPVAAVTLSVTAVALILLHRTLLMVRLARWFQDRAVPWMVDRYERRCAGRSATGRGGGGLRRLLAGASFGVFGRFERGGGVLPREHPAGPGVRDRRRAERHRAGLHQPAARADRGRSSGIPGVGDVESVVTTVGGGDQWSGMFGGAATGRWPIAFRPYFEEREGDAFALMAAMQESLGDGIAGAEVKVASPSNSPPTARP
jgi:multidrug efflux pump